MRVLIADRQPVARAALRKLLEEAGFEICAEAAGATDAIDLAAEQRPDICVIDVLLPGDGIAAMQAISSAAPETAIVAFTTSEERHHLLDAIRAGARGYLLKRMNPGRLPAALQGVLRGEAAIPREMVSALAGELHTDGRGRTVTGRLGEVELTSREREVARLLVEGLDSAAVARRLGMAPVTVRRHAATINAKLGVKHRAEAIALLTGHDV